MDNRTILKYLPYAQAAYGAGGSDSHVYYPVGDFKPLNIPGFEPTKDSGFNGVLLYNQKTGEYRLGIAGTTFKTENGSLDGKDIGADGHLAAQTVLRNAEGYVSKWHDQFSDSMRFATAAFSFIKDRMTDESGGVSPTVDQIRERMSVVGHSLGGAQAELIAKYLGIGGANIDGPGVNQMLDSDGYKELQQFGLALGLRENYNMEGIGFVSNGYTVVSQPGVHIAGSNFDSAQGAQGRYTNAFGGIVAGAFFGGIGGALVGGAIGVGTSGYDIIVNHPSGAIARYIESQLGIADGIKANFDTFGFEDAPQWELFKRNPNVATLALMYSWVDSQRVDNVAKNLSPSGYVIDAQEHLSADGRYMVQVSKVDEVIYESYRRIGEDEAAFSKKFIVNNGVVGVFNQDNNLQFFERSVANPDQTLLVTVKTDRTLEIRNVNADDAPTATYRLSDDQFLDLITGNMIIERMSVNSAGAVIRLKGVDVAAESFMMDGRNQRHLPRDGGATGDDADPAEWSYGGPVGAAGWEEMTDPTGRYLISPDGNRVKLGIDQKIVVDPFSGIPAIVSKDAEYAIPSNGSLTAVMPDGAVVTVKFDENGQESGRSLVEQTGQATSVKEFDARGGLISVSSIETKADGSVLTTHAEPGTTSRSVLTDKAGSVVEVRESKFSGQSSVTAVYDGKGEPKFTTTVTSQGASGWQAETVFPDGGWVKDTYNAKGDLIGRDGAQSPLAAFGAAISDINSLVGAVKSGQAIPILSNGLTLLNHQVNPVVSGSQVIANQALFTTTAVAGAVGSLYGLYNVFANGGTTLQKLTASAGALVAVNNATQAVAAEIGKEAAEEAAKSALNGAASAIGKALPWISVAASLQQGDYKGAAVGVAAAMGVPYIGWIYAAYMLVSSILHEEPDAWGYARFKFDIGTDVTLDTTGYGIGKNKVDLLMQGNGLAPTDSNYFGGLLGYLKDQVTTANRFAPDQPVGIIAQRLPTLSWHQANDAQEGYMLTDLDPITGEERYPTLRYDDNFRVLNGDAQDPAQRMDLFSRLVMSAVGREAIAPMWEVRTARMQQDLGDPQAGLTEEQRAARHGWTAPAGADGKRLPGKFLPVVLDLDDDGRIATTSKSESGVSFNWDDGGFYKETAWVKASDGFLVLDRNLNGVADGGKELFSNSNVADEAKGLRSLRWADANLDGVIDARDPVFEALRVWRDANQDGMQDKDETSSLADLGITRIDYGNGRYTKGGTDHLIRSQELEADADGVQVSVVKGGIQINYASGKSTLFVSDVLDAEGLDGAGSDFIVKNDRVDTWEDGISPDNPQDPTHPRKQAPGDHQSISIGAAQLLGNDRVLPNNTVTITGVGNAEHGTVTFNAETQVVEFMPEHNYNGTASFTYTATDAQGRTRTGNVTVNLQAVADAPTTTFEGEKRAIFGYSPLVGFATYYIGEDSSSELDLGRERGQVLYSPYQTVMGREYGRPDENNPLPSYGPWQDTGIPLSLFQQKYDEAVRHTSGENSPPDAIGILIDGVRYAIPATPPVVDHNSPIGFEDGTEGYIRVNAPDSPGATFRFELDDSPGSAPLYGNVTIDPATGRYAYVGRTWREMGFDGYPVGHDVDSNDHVRGDPVQIDVFYVKVIDTSDPSGNTFTRAEIKVPHYGELPRGEISGGGGKPIAIDLNGDGFHFTDVDDSNVFFDVNGDGWRRRMAWNNGSDGFIAYDKNGDGQITSFDEISFVPYKAGSQTDLEGLAAFDSNHDGKISAADDKWSSFGVWQDANEDGVSDPGEFRSLDSFGISAVQLGSDGKFQVIDGQTVNGIGSATRTDGGSYALADVTLRYRNVTQGRTDQGEVVTAPIAPVSAGQTFTGTEGADLVFGTAGNDQYHLGAGNDVVSDGDGDDAVDGGDGNDIVMTGAGNDFVDAGNGNDQAFTDAGDDVVLTGAGDDFVTAGDGNDIVFGGEGHDMLSGGSGNDLLSGDQGDDQLFGESGRDVLFGMDGDDQLFAGDNDDQLDGGAGNDVLDGGSGADLMTGGGGSDRYAVDNAGDVVAETANGGYDSVTVDNLADYTLGADVEALQLGKNAVNGTGNALDNAIWGNDNANNLDGREGADTMAGGDGDDTYIVDNAGDQVIEYANKGNDTIVSSIDYTLGSNVENLTLTGDATRAIGNLMDNRLSGNDGDNLLAGGGGRDTLIGGRGNDRYVVDGAEDSILEQANEGIDSVESSVSYGLSDNLENLTLTGSADLGGTGNAGANLIVGNAGRNRLDGGAGDDTLIGGGGDDTYVVDSSADRVVEVAGGGQDQVIASADYALGDEIEQLTLVGSAVRGTGNALDNLITGNDADNRLDGAGGRDTLIGGLGNDTYVVDGADDVVTERAGEGVDTVEAALDYTLGADLENLTLRPGAAVRGTGNALDNVITGNANANVLDGMGGRDTLVGGAGDDLYVVDSTEVGIVEQADEGHDRVEASVNWTLADHVEDLTLTGTDDIDGTGNDLANTIIGTVGNNRLDGSGGNDQLVGGAGDDTYIVDSAGDVVVERAGEGHDVVESSVDYTLADGLEDLRLSYGAHLGVGNAADNVIEGIAQDGRDRPDDNGAATLRGEGGNDTLISHQGHDRMSGGTGDDTYVIETLGFDGAVTEDADGGIDTVRSYADLELSANVENLTLLGFAERGVGNELDNLIVAAERGGRIYGGAGNDTLIGGAGTDLLEGGSGADQMSGGGGDDQYVVDNAGDVILEEAGGGGNSETQEVIDTIKGNWSWLPGAAGVVDAVVEYVRARPGQDIVWPDMVAAIEQQGVGDTWILSLYQSQFEPLTTLDYSGGGAVVGGGTDTVTASIDYSLTDNVENLVLAGEAGLNGTGNELVNQLTGNIGANRLDGGMGADLLVGGRGDDTYVVDDAGDVIVEGVAADKPWSLELRVLTEVLKRQAVADGHWDVDAVEPAMASIDTLLTEAAAQGPEALAAVDLFDVAFDLARGEALQANRLNAMLMEQLPLSDLAGAIDGGRDVVYASVDFVAPIGVEDVVLTGDAMRATGNALDNMLTGNAMDNILDGGDGNDRLTGGAGNDTLIGGAGDDFFAWAAGDGMDSVSDAGGHDVLALDAGLNANALDYVTEEVDGQWRTTLIRLDAQGQASGEGVQLNGSAATGFEIESIRFADGTNSSVEALLAAIDARKKPADGSEDYVGTEGNDTFRLADAKSGVVNRYHGKAGTDTIVGGWGYDHLRVSSTLSSLDSIEVLDGVNADFKTNFIDGTDGADRWDFSGKTVRNFLIAPGAGDDVVIGTSGGDLIEGGMGADQLFGGDGNDSFLLTRGDQSVDLYDGGNGVNTIRDEYGYDVLRVESGLTNLRNIQVIDGVDRDLGVNRIVASDSADTLDFSGKTIRNFTIEAGGGDDIVIGTGGNDLIRGGAGNDSLSGGDGDDTFLLSGGDQDGKDQFDGGAGVNTIRGGYSVDVLRVENHLANLRNIQVLDGLNRPGEGDRISASDGNDTLDFSAMTVRGFVLDGGAGSDDITGTAGDDMFRGGTGDDELKGGGGNDTYLWGYGDGNDHIRDMAGTNLIRLQDGIARSAVSVISSDNSFALRVGGAILTIDRVLDASMQVRIGSTTYAIEDLQEQPATMKTQDTATAWAEADGGASGQELGWSDGSSTPVSPSDDSHATTGLIGTSTRRMSAY